MFDHEKNLFDSHATKRIRVDGAQARRCWAANAAFASSISRAMAANFDWKFQPMR